MGSSLLFLGLLSSSPLHLLFFRVNSLSSSMSLSSSIAPLVTIMDVEVERDVVLSNPVDIPENVVRMSLSTWEYSQVWGRFTFSIPSMVATSEQRQNGLMIAAIPNIPKAPRVLVTESSDSYEEDLPPDASTWSLKAYKRGLVRDRAAKLLEGMKAKFKGEIPLVEKGISRMTSWLLRTLGLEDVVQDFRRRLLSLQKVSLSIPMLLVLYAPLRGVGVFGLHVSVVMECVWLGWGTEETIALIDI
ncbi:hypothetical protein AMTRI_Chr13g88590 [Amborella trichopoda]